MRFSRYLALIFGLLLPVAETIRRWHTWQEYPPALFDDYLIGAFLLYGAWRCRRNLRDGQKYLAAALAFGCGMGYMSFFGHLKNLDAPDPAPVPHLWVTAVIGIGWGLMIAALIQSLKRLPEKIA